MTLIFVMGWGRENYISAGLTTDGSMVKVRGNQCEHINNSLVLYTHYLQALCTFLSLNPRRQCQLTHLNPILSLPLYLVTIISCTFSLITCGVVL